MISGNSTSSSNKDLVKAIRMDFTVKRGDYFSYVYDVTYIDDTGTEQVYDLTGCYAQMHLKKKKTDSHYYTAMAVNMDTAAGTITFFKSAVDMKIDAGTYWYDLEIKDANGKNITWIEGKFKVIQDVTDYIDETAQHIAVKLQSLLNFFKPKVPWLSYKTMFGRTIEYHKQGQKNLKILLGSRYFIKVIRMPYSFLTIGLKSLLKIVAQLNKRINVSIGSGYSLTSYVYFSSGIGLYSELRIRLSYTE